MCSKKIEVEDWTDEYFSIMEELGIDVNFQIGYKESPNPDEEIKWTPYPHNEFDGIGGFANKLRSFGWPINTLASSKDNAPPSLPSLSLMIVRILLYRLTRKKPKPVSWKFYNKDKQSGSSQIFAVLLDKTQTQNLVSAAKLERVTVNTYLLKYLDEIVREMLQNDQKSNTWLIPINLRGAINRKSDESNHLSFFPSRIDRGDSLEKIQQRNDKRLRQKLHWLAWYFFNIKGKRKGRQGIENIVKKSLNNQVGLVGFFSNLGSWPHENDAEAVKKIAQERKDQGSWYLSHHGKPTWPIGVWVLTWLGQLAITIQVHPSISNDPEIGKKMIEEFIEKVDHIAF